MKKYNEGFELTQEELDNIATYMDDEIREDVAFDLAPCTPEELRHKLTEIALELKAEKADSIFNAIKLIERLEWINRVLLKEIER